MLFHPLFRMLLLLTTAMLVPIGSIAASRDSQPAGNLSTIGATPQRSILKHNTVSAAYNPQLEIKDATTALARNSKDANAYEKRGAAYNKLEMWAEAILDLNLAITYGPTSPRAFFHRGLACYKLKRYPQALQDLTTAIRLNPYLAPAYACRANLFTSTQKYQLALRDAREALRLNPNDSANHLALSRAQYYVGQHGASAQECTKAIKINPKNPLAWDNRGVAYLQAKQFKSAIADFTKAIALKSDEAKYYCHRGIVYLEIGDYDHAIQDLTKAISLKGDYSLALFDRGVSYFRMGKYELAHKDITTAIHYDSHYALAWEELPLDPTKLPTHKEPMDNPEDWYYRAADKILLKRNETSLDDLKKYIEMAGWQDKLSIDAAILLYLGYKQQHDDVKAKDVLNQAIQYCDRAKRAYAMLNFLNKDIAEDDLLKLSLTQDEKTEAHSLIGLEHLLSHRKEKAMLYLNWVAKQGQGATTTYSLALREIEKLHPIKTLNSERFYEHPSK